MEPAQPGAGHALAASSVVSRGRAADEPRRVAASLVAASGARTQSITRRYGL